MLDVKLKFDERALRKAVNRAFDDYVDNRGFDYDCPSCGARVQLRTGRNECPRCGYGIVVQKRS